MDNPLELSDGDFLKWAGANPQRWALLPSDRREAWLDHLIARMKMTADTEQHNAYWRVAYVIACADAPATLETAAERGPAVVGAGM
jgi:hypothetical protein